MGGQEARVCMWGGGGDDAEERWGDVVWELIIKLERTKEREMSSYCGDEVWKEQRSRDLTEEDTGGMEGRSRRRGSEREDKKMVNEVYEYTTCYWLTAFLVNCIFPMIASWLALLNENYPPILLFFFFTESELEPTVTGREKNKNKDNPFYVISLPAIYPKRNICLCSINPPMGNGHAVQVQRSICKYIGSATYLFSSKVLCIIYFCHACCCWGTAISPIAG